MKKSNLLIAVSTALNLSMASSAFAQEFDNVQGYLGYHGSTNAIDNHHDSAIAGLESEHFGLEFRSVTDSGDYTKPEDMNIFSGVLFKADFGFDSAPYWVVGPNLELDDSPIALGVGYEIAMDGPLFSRVEVMSLNGSLEADSMNYGVAFGIKF